MNERLLKMPRLGETMDEGKIVGWLIKPGDSFSRGDPIIEIETDKTVAEFPALGNGKLTEILVDLDQTIGVGTPIARVELGEGPDWTREEGEEPAPEPAAAAGVEVDLPMPRLGETMEEGRLSRWLKQPGESFTRGEAIVEIETDKTLAEFPALSDGVLVDHLRHEDEMVTVGEPIARILVQQADAQGETAQAKPAPQAASSQAATPTPAPQRTASGSEKRRATPLARRLARQRGIDLHGITGTGRRGRIEKEDVLGLERNVQVTPIAASARDGVQFLSLKSGRLAYSDSGGGGETYLLLHGFSGDRTTWATTISALQRAGKRVIAVDLPGHGVTEIEAKSGEDLSRDLPEFMQALHLKRLHLVAHSLGAVAAVDLALTKPECIASLTLIAPAGLGSEIDSEFIRGMAAVSSKGELSHLLRRLSVNDVALSDAALETLSQQLGQGRLKALAEAINGASGQRVDIIAALQKLVTSIPVKVIFGLEDRIIPWSQVKALPPRVAIHLLSRSGHMPQWDQPRDVQDILLSSTRAGGGL